MHGTSSGRIGRPSSPVQARSPNEQVAANSLRIIVKSKLGTTPHTSVTERSAYSGQKTSKYVHSMRCVCSMRRQASAIIGRAYVIDEHRSEPQATSKAATKMLADLA